MASSTSAPSSNKNHPKLPSFLQSTPADIHEKYVDLEWQQRHRLRQGNEPGSEWAWLQGDEIARRNRYVNIDPYEKNRVKLRVPEGINDYVNASPIILRGKRGTERRYIAMQGPLESTVSHVWRMIWHETSSVAVIVMVTQTHDEAGREKCFQYFPGNAKEGTLHINQHNEFRDGETATVTLEDSTYNKEARCTVRKLRMQVGQRSKTVYHLAFLGWPDFLVPEGDDRVALLELIKLSARLNNEAGDGATNPRIVHCSAGIGRTGTFIALEHLMGELEDGVLEAPPLPKGEDVVVETIDALRRQRMGMVQMEAQMRFLYDISRERWVVKYGGGG